MLCCMARLQSHRCFGSIRYVAFVLITQRLHKQDLLQHLARNGPIFAGFLPVVLFHMWHCYSRFMLPFERLLPWLVYFCEH